ncbi:hypothetical protein PYCCODRAFT_1252495 [Trametes coccinea BRFM310]|uniref:Uncharacterized protein n=1 Tax=Trametes coccinea (strain BRFM310) TaxID=1353009 RepID=A0A1Y2I6G8_TRAC3|nr:hypothetical protein PYCCODRAFT_1252495 [Trametes coccinea BRFM310]
MFWESTVVVMAEGRGRGEGALRHPPADHVSTRGSHPPHIPALPPSFSRLPCHPVTSIMALTSCRCLGGGAFAVLEYDSFRVSRYSSKPTASYARIESSFERDTASRIGKHGSLGLTTFLGPQMARTQHGHTASVAQNHFYVGRLDVIAGFGDGRLRFLVTIHPLSVEFPFSQHMVTVSPGRPP